MRRIVPVARRAIACVTAVGLLVGCTTVHTEKVARFTPAVATEKHATIETPGVYQVRWRRTSTEKLLPVAGTSRYLPAGTPGGFGTQPDGSLVAFAGDERIPMPAGPRDAKYVSWHTRWTETTDLGDGLADFADGAGKVLIAATVVGLVFVLWTIDDDSCHRHHLHDCRRCR